MPGTPPPPETQFESRVAALTGLDQRVVRAWVTIEGAYAPGGTGGYNYLNIREGTSKSGVPIAGTTQRGFAHFRSAGDAATETAFLINHLSSYLGIRRSTKMGPRAQLAAIAASPWDAGHYGGGRKLYSTYNTQNKGGGISFGKVLDGTGRVVGDLLNPVSGAEDVAGAAGGAAGHIPVVGGAVQGAISAAEAPAKIAEDIGKVVGFIFNPEDWLRVGYILAGGVFVLGGLLILARSVGAVQGAAAVAFPEGTLASQLAGKGGGGASTPRPRDRTRTKTVYVMDEEANRREAVRRRAARAEPSNDIPF